MSTPPAPPSLYERFMNGVSDIDLNARTFSDPSVSVVGIGSSSRSPPQVANPINKRHIPKVPASGIDPHTGTPIQRLGNSKEESNCSGFEGSSRKGMSEGNEKLVQNASFSSGDNKPKMSKVTRETLQRCRKMIPPMLPHFHKGQMGRVAVIGGSEDYTGAPYFSAMASARLGADMSHVICEPQAAQVIKSYSPNLMVHPLMRQKSHILSNETPSSIADTIIAMLPRIHALVIGPGLGRDELMHDVCGRVIAAAKESAIPFVLDADGLNIAITKPELVMGYRECILTPNIVEFGRLCKSQGIDPESFNKDSGEGAEQLAKKFGGVTVVQKGGRDWISNGTTTVMSDLEGGYKRSGGQGDTLTGSLATFLAWRKAYLDKIWDHEGDLDKWELLALAAFGGSSITRECSRLAFQKHGRSLQASDLTEMVAVAFRNLFEEGTGDDAKL